MDDQPTTQNRRFTLLRGTIRFMPSLISYEKSETDGLGFILAHAVYHPFSYQIPSSA